MNIIIITNHPYQNQAGIFSLENIVLRFNNYMTVCNQNANYFVNTRWKRTMLPCDDCYYYYYVKFSTGIFPGEKYPVKSHPETSDFQHFSEDMCRSEECRLLHRSCSVLSS